MVCFQFSSCPYKRELFGCEVSLPLTSPAQSAEQRLSFSVLQTCICLSPVRYVQLNKAGPLGEGVAGSWPEPDWPSQPPSAATPEQCTECTGPRDIYKRISGAFASFRSTEGPWRQGMHRAFSSFSLGGNTYSDSRDGPSTLIASAYSITSPTTSRESGGRQ